MEPDLPHAGDISTDPRAHLRPASPHDVVSDPSLTAEEKKAVLESWGRDLERRLESEGEGMSAQNPISLRAESALADELSEVGHALLALGEDHAAA